MRGKRCQIVQFMSKSCQVIIDIKETSAVLGITDKQWDDNGNPIPDMPPDQFQILYESVKDKTRFDIDMMCGGKCRRIRSPLADPDPIKREVILRMTLSGAMQVISKQFDNLCKE